MAGKRGSARPLRLGGALRFFDTLKDVPTVLFAGTLERHDPHVGDASEVEESLEAFGFSEVTRDSTDQDLAIVLPAELETPGVRKNAFQRAADRLVSLSADR